MRRILLLTCLMATLGAQGSLRVVAVTRKGLPPFQVADRIYRLAGADAGSLRVGQRLLVRRAGLPKALGHLRITEVQGAEADSVFLPSGTAYPMKGDGATLELLAPLPDLPDPGPGPEALPAMLQPGIEAPPREGLLYFLPQQADLSPAGHQKLQAWIAAWGTTGRWAVQVPTTHALSPALQRRRAEALQGALRALGIAHAEVETAARAADGRYDPTWVRHWD